MRGLLLLALLAGCKKAPAPAAPASTASATVVNETGAEVHEVFVSCPGQSFSSSTPSMKAGETIKVALPSECTRVSVMFTRRPDLKSEKTADRLGDTIEFTLRSDGTIGASLGNVFGK